VTASRHAVVRPAVRIGTANVVMVTPELVDEDGVVGGQNHLTD
jgi:hypothetical protein